MFLLSNPTNPPIYCSSPDQACPVTSLDGEGTTESLSFRPDHIRTETASRGAGIARISSRPSRPARVFAFDPTTPLQFRPSFSLALLGGAPSYPSRGRSVPSPIFSLFVPDQASVQLRSPSMSYGRPANHCGCLLRALGELTSAGNELNRLLVDPTIFKLTIIETHF